MHPFYDKVTDKARQALSTASAFAKHRKHPFVTPLHVLYGILAQGDNVATSILQLLSVDVDIIRQKIIQELGHGCYDSHNVTVPYSKETGKLICHAIDYGLEVGFIACQHLLKAILIDKKNIACTILLNSNVNFELVDLVIKSNVKTVNKNLIPPPLPTKQQKSYLASERQQVEIY